MDAGEKENGKETIFLREGYVTICYPGHGHLSKLGDVFPGTSWKHTLLYINNYYILITGTNEIFKAPL